MRALQQQLRFLFAVLLMMALATPCDAMVAPLFTTVVSWDDFLARYHSEDDPDALREYVSQQPLTCTGSTVLDGTQGGLMLTAFQGIRVAPGAVLTVDNPDLLLMGPPPFITVERGGTLQILCWNEMMTDGSMPTAGMIRVEAGGTLQVDDELTLPAGMVTVEEDTPPNTILPPDYETKPEPEPEPEPELIPIEALHESIPQVESVTGQTSVEVVLPNTVQVRLSHEAGDLALAVEWDLSGVSFDTPGIYTVYGDFIPDGLIFKGVSNPKGLRPVVSLTILASTPVWDLVWTITEPVSDGSALFRLSFSPLPEGVEHLYLQRSTDGVHWNRCASENRPQDTDLLSDVTTQKGMSVLTSRQRIETAGFYLRLEVVGSLRAGSSNILYIHALANGEDGSSEGNRGGTQGTFDREGQKESEETSAAPETAKDMESPQEELPEQVESNQTETEEVQLEQETGLIGSTNSGGSSGYDNGLDEKLEPPVIQPLIHHESDSTEKVVVPVAVHQSADIALPVAPHQSTKKAVPEAPHQSADVATMPEEVVESQPTLDTEMPTMAQPLAEESHVSEPQGDGDTNGFVAVATLVVCLFSAAGLYILHKRSIKRKS